MLSKEIPSDSGINIITKLQKTRMKAFKGETDMKGVGRSKSEKKSGNEIRTRAELIVRGRKLHT